MSFDDERRIRITELGKRTDIAARADALFLEMCRCRYHYNFSACGQPIIQFPEDIVAVQELIWEAQPDLIIETGVARGGSLMLSASTLESIGHGRVVGIDVDIRAPNRLAIESHRLAHRIDLIEGSSIDRTVVETVSAMASQVRRVMVLLDSNHTHDHVLDELNSYGALVSVGSFLVVCDTVIEQLPAELSADRPWGKGNSPMSALERYLADTDRFEVCRDVCDKLLLTAHPNGYLRRIR